MINYLSQQDDLEADCNAYGRVLRLRIILVVLQNKISKLLSMNNQSGYF